MSDTSEALASAWSAVKGLRTSEEKGPNAEGDDFAAEVDSWGDAVLARFGALVNANDQVIADVNNQNTTSEVGDFGSLSVSDVLEGPSVATVANLPDPADLSAGASVYVESENRYYKVEA